MGVILVTHDIGVASEIADEVIVMYAGRIVEMGPIRAMLREPQHPDTRGLLAGKAVPSLARVGDQHVAHCVLATSGSHH